MGRIRTGYTWQDKEKKWWAGITYEDESGRRRYAKRRAKNASDADDKKWELLKKYKLGGASALEHDEKTFEQVAREFRASHLVEARFVGDRQVAGLRSARTPRKFIDDLIAHFGKKKIRAIKHSDVKRLKLLRLDTPTAPGRAMTSAINAVLAKSATKAQERKKIYGRRLAKIPEAELLLLRGRYEQRAVATVNRELAVLRALFRFAKREGYVARSPFEEGEPLISTSAEVQRERILTRDEEAALLIRCRAERAHLRPLLICALDTAMRAGEILKLERRDVDLSARRIQVRRETTKTGRPRQVPVSHRLAYELERLLDRLPDDPRSVVFGLSTVKKSFATACRLAGVVDFRFHDCRHTATTRMIAGGMPPMEVMKITGHTQMTTFARYVNSDEETVRRAGEVIDEQQRIADEARRASKVQSEESGMVN